MMSSDTKLLVYFAPVLLQSPAQRPHFFADFIHRQLGWDVLWIEPPPGRLPNWNDLRISRERGSHAGSPWPFESARANWLPVEPIPLIRRVNDLLGRDLFRMLESQLALGRDLVFAVGRPSRLALKALRRWPERALLYDAMDDFPRFYRGLSAAYNRKIENAIADTVSHILISSSVLAEKFRSCAASLTLIPNAFDADRCMMIAPRARRRVAGYVGTLGSWFDWGALISAARRRPDYEFPIIGPVFSEPESELPPNVELVGPLPHDRALETAAGFDVGLIPFRDTPLTAAVDPVKYYEYKALGLPVCSASFGQMVVRRGETNVFIYDQPVDLAAAIDAALATDIDPIETLRFREENSWNHRFETILPLLDPAESRS